jgi:hypothetical protein
MSVTRQAETATPGQDDVLGPIDAAVITWPPGAPMTGSAAPLLVDLVDRGIVRIFDLMFVTKGEDGSVTAFEAKDLSDKDVGEFKVFEGASSGLLGDDDVREAAEAIDPGWSAAVIVYENRWVLPFVSALRQNGGDVIDVQRISPAQLVDVLEAAEAAS